MLNIVNLPPPDQWSEEGIYNRLIQQLPSNWFSPNDHKLVDTVLQGFITTAKLNFDQLQYVFNQMRIQTATGQNLDLISLDYFGGNLPRKYNGQIPETDLSFRNRILATLLQEKTTRYGMQNALYLLTGIQPIIFEPWNYYDCGAYNVPTLAYNTLGKYGSGSYLGQVFIDVFINAFDEMGGFAGYNSTFGGLNYAEPNARLFYGNPSLVKRRVSDDDVYQMINITKPEGILCWVRINFIYKGNR